MEIFPFDQTVQDIFKPQDIADIAADGISIRSGNKVIRLQVTEETVVDDNEAVREELETKFAEQYDILVQQFDKYKDQMRYALDGEKNKLIKKQDELDQRLRDATVLPSITSKHLKAGLSVGVSSGGNGLIWLYKTVYAPKYVGNRMIDPVFAKRLVTPVCLEILTRPDTRIYSLKVMQILGGNKFQHYHSISNSGDCWGNFTYDGLKVPTVDDMLNFCKSVDGLLETINDLSIGTSNPRGLSRLETIEKHLFAADESRDSGPLPTNSRNARAGVNLEERQEATSDAVWSVE
ncbi:MAG: hypothetical protein KAS32_03395 [Candidatus Peribacteraceae bacterium]|nr:hypothetical protein [Candidatus Peribacteraceae bacterium]